MQNEAYSLDLSPQFCFKYFINLGNDRFGCMTINETTNLYEEAENFCHTYSLDPQVAIYLENEMFMEVLKVKEQLSVRQASSNNCSVGRISKNPSVDRKQLKRETSSGSILRQSINYTVASFRENKKQQGKPKAKRSNSRHFEEMFRRHEQIETKKELSRKASIEKIPFKPAINSLSRKIIDLKRRSQKKMNDPETIKEGGRQRNQENREANSKEKMKKVRVKLL